MIDASLFTQPMLRRCDVVDADFRVIMRGPSAEQMLPVATEETLEVELGREVAAVVALHDFRRHPIATALVGTEYGLRIARLPGARSNYYSVATERLTLGSRLRRIAALHRLDAGEQELLRLLVGGYDEREIAQRLDASRADLRDRTRRLRGKLGCTRRSDLATLVFGIDATHDPAVDRRARA
ncbi:MAG: hypothetical protein GIX03_14600 [Candidatus Eremiobacteraeota bacterium]|nr:hypothetical protein [Candidatus Eremiobacteraeota bacterium]MBC5804196.1 hypothetical protein [Candidatus Eremiobacteraeota bacterium]MBC5822604.1 hypothetical protein [Candidatus Eremiobacteraeota bacterium]